MALGPRLDLRQTQSLVMTPQLQQAIKLLALSNLELETFIGEAREANPLLERGESSGEYAGEAVPEPAGEAPAGETTADQRMREGKAEADAPFDLDPEALGHDRETGDGATIELSGRIETSEGEGPGIDERADDGDTLAEHLEAQVGAVAESASEAFIARHLLGLLDEAGYLTASLREVASELGASLAEGEAALGVVQQLDPTGVGARTLSECLALQAKEADRYDPCMAKLIDNLDLVARGEFARLKRMCDVDDEDFADMLSELRGYDPKPGLRLGGGEREPVVPDILVTPGANGAWSIALNEATLPRLVVNRRY